MHVPTSPEARTTASRTELHPGRPARALRAFLARPRPAGIALVAILACGVAAAASAEAKTHERRLDATFAVDVSAPDGQPLPTTGAITMWVPKGVRNAGETMPFCDPRLIEARGSQAACPLRSIVGRGRASGSIAFVSETAIEPMAVTMFNGPGNTLLAEVRGMSPVSIDVVLQSIIRKPAGRYGMQLSFPFPDSLIHPVPGSTASLLHVEARLNGKVGWLRTTSCPTRGWSLGAMLSTIDGSSTTITADLACV